MAGESNFSKYKDLDLDFIAHPVTGDVVQKFGADAIKRSVKNLIYMRQYEKPFQPQIHSKIRSLLFEPDTPLVKIELKKTIISVLTQYEPRIRLTRVQVVSSPDTYAYNIGINYKIINQPNTQTVSVQLKRLR